MNTVTFTDFGRKICVNSNFKVIVRKKRRGEKSLLTYVNNTGILEVQ